MNWLDELLLQEADRREIVSPIWVRSSLSSASTGLFYDRHYPVRHRWIGISFGAATRFSDRDSLKFTIAHELTHVQRDYVPTSLHAFVKSLGSDRRVRRKKNQSLCGKEEELLIDRIVAECHSREAFAREIVLSSAVYVGTQDLLKRRRIGKVEPVWDLASIPFRADFCEYTDVELDQIVLETFRSDRESFVSCATRVRHYDHVDDESPSMYERLENLGLDWDTIQATCNFSKEKLLDIDQFLLWAPTEWKLVVDVDWRGRLRLARDGP